MNNNNHAIKHQALRFLLIGILNTLVGYSMYAFFLFCGLNYSLALGLATVLGVLFNFKTIGTLVFRVNRNTLIFRFILVYIVTFCLNLLLIKMFIQFGLNAYTAGVITIIPMAAASFLLNKYFVFDR